MLVPSMDDSVLQRSVVVTQHSCRINKRDHATMLTPELHTYRQEPMYVMALLESKYFHIFFMDSVSWLHSPTCIVCGYQLADSEAFQVLAVKESKDTVVFGQIFMPSVGIV